jgi:excisionase family DNA binding protein
MPTPVSKTGLEPEAVLMTVPDAARFLCIGRTKAWAMVRSGEIPSILLGRSVRVPRAELLRVVDAWPRRVDGREKGREGASRARQAKGRSPGATHAKSRARSGEANP